MFVEKINECLAGENKSNMNEINSKFYTEIKIPDDYGLMDFINSLFFHEFSSKNENVIEFEINEKILYPIREGWLFRGMMDSSWRLETSLERLIKAMPQEFKKEIGNQNEALERKMLANFKRYAHSVFERVPKENELEEWLALMQYYEVATRLLDWTYSLYVSVFFAIEQLKFEDEEQKKTCSVWAIKSDQIVLNSFNKLKRTAEEELICYLEMGLNKKPGRFSGLFNAARNQEIQGILHMTPFYYNDRLRHQQGTFLLNLNLKKSFEEALIDLQIDEQYVIKINITLDKKHQIKLLRQLDAMNINHATIYPDIKGYAQYNNMRAILESPNIPIR